MSPRPTKPLFSSSSPRERLHDELSAYRIMMNQYESKDNAVVQKDLAAGKRVVMYFMAQNPDTTSPIRLVPVHSVLMKKIVLKQDGTLDMEKSTCDTKNGWAQLKPDVTVQSVVDFYSKKDPAPVAYYLRVLK